MSEQFNWRKYLRVHPAADKLPMMEETELEELADDIKANGLRTGITIWGKKPDQPDKELPVLIDGRNRLDAVAQAGMLAVNNHGHLCIRTSDDTGQGLRLIKYNYREGDPHKLSRSLNVIRRHLSPETKRRLIAELLQQNPQQSNRAIAKAADDDHRRVASVRRDLEGRGQIDHVETHTDSRGRQQPAAKPRKPPRHFTGHDLDETEEVAVGIEIFKWLSWNGRTLMMSGIDTLYKAWRKGEPDEKPDLSQLFVRLFKRLNIDDQGKVLDAIDQIYTDENVEGV